MFKISVRLISVLLSIYILTACGDKEVVSPEPIQTFDDAIRAGGEFAEVTERDTVLFETMEMETRGDGSIWSCTRKKRSVTKAPEDYPNFNPNAEVLFPGNLLQGKTLRYATPEPIPVKRAGGTIVMILLNGAGIHQIEVEEVTLGNVIEAENAILAQSASAEVAANSPSRWKR